LAPWGTGIFDFLCIGYLAFFLLHKLKWREMNKKENLATAVVLFLMFVSLLDTVFSIVLQNQSFIANLLRPFICCAMLPNIKDNLTAVIYDLKESITILVIIFSFIFYFTLFGYFVFARSFGGSIVFPDIGTGYYNMIILLTTSNFPDVMLPSYSNNPNAFFFYFAFLTFGLFFLLNVLLAVVYTNYQRQIVELAEKKTKTRLKHITSYYHCYDVE